MILHSHDESFIYTYLHISLDIIFLVFSYFAQIFYFVFSSFIMIFFLHFMFFFIKIIFIPNSKSHSAPKSHYSVTSLNKLFYIQPSLLFHSQLLDLIKASDFLELRSFTSPLMYYNFHGMTKHLKV